MAGHCALIWSEITLALWVGYCLLFHIANRMSSPFRRDLVQSVTTISVIMSLYLLLGHLGFAVIPWDGDRLVDGIDRWIGNGVAPVVWLNNHLEGNFTEFFAFIYALFIPYLYFSIFICLLGRSDRERPMFVTALALTYAVSFVGYLLIPAYGPLVYNQDEFSSPLPQGYFQVLVYTTVHDAGGPFGAFPSLHVGASWLLCFFDLRRRQLRGLLYVPFVVCIACATLVLRFHYVTDIIVGFFIATAATLVAERIYDWPREKQSIVTNLWRRALFCFYDSIQVRGVERIPTQVPVLLLSNHGNAFIDPLILRVACGRRLRLTAKAALLDNPCLAWLIRLLGIITFARAQDKAIESRRQINEAAFQRCFQSLDRNEIVCLFPEGKSHSEPALLPIKSGAARLASDYLKGSPERQLFVIPTGMYYEAKERFGSRVLVTFGEPLILSNLSHDSRTVHELTEQFSRCLIELTPNFHDHRTAEIFLWISELYQCHGKDPAAVDQGWHMPAEFIPVTNRLITSHRDPANQPKLSSLENQAAALYDRSRQLGLAADEVFLPIHPGKAFLFLVRELEILTIGSLLFSMGILLNFPAILANMYLVPHISKDRDHWATHYLFFGAALLVLWLSLAVSALMMLFSPAATGPFLVASIFCGYFSLRYLQRLRRTLRRTRVFLTFLLNPKEKRELREQCMSLIREIDRILTDEQQKRNLRG